MQTTLAALLVTEMVAMADGKSVQGLLEALYAEVVTVIHARRLNFNRPRVTSSWRVPLRLPHLSQASDQVIRPLG